MSTDTGLFDLGSTDDALRTADLSEDGLYRYRLTRVWGAPNLLPFIMLNPSTADAFIDDPTIVRCRRFARDMGYGGLEVVNLYAYRATKPADLWKAEDPVGPRNNRILGELLDRAWMSGTPVIAAWGANAKPDRVRWLLRRCEGQHTLHALRVTKGGAPGHPLYLPASARPVPWGVAA